MKPQLSDAFLAVCLKTIAVKRQKHMGGGRLTAVVTGTGRKEYVMRGDEVRTNITGGAGVGWRGLACCIVTCS